MRKVCLIWSVTLVQWYTSILILFMRMSINVIVTKLFFPKPQLLTLGESLKGKGVMVTDFSCK